MAKQPLQLTLPLLTSKFCGPRKTEFSIYTWLCN